MNENQLKYATLIGLFLMNQPIPNDILEYVRSTPYITDDQDWWMITSLLRNAPELDSIILYQMVRRLL